MPLTTTAIKAQLQSRIAPGDDSRFFQLLTEADERLLKTGRWRWVREAVTLEVEDGQIRLPMETYECIMAARINGVGKRITWEEFGYFEGGATEVSICGCSGAQLVDLGVISDEDDLFRVYRVAGSSSDEVEVLARFSPVSISSTATDPRCGSLGALKNAMLAIIYEESNNQEISMNYLAMARGILDEEEAAYRGAAKSMFKPSLTMPLNRRARRNMP